MTYLGMPRPQHGIWVVFILPNSDEHRKIPVSRNQSGLFAWGRILCMVDVVRILRAIFFSI